MSKFSSFLVFVLGILLLVVTLYTMGQRFFGGSKQTQEEVAPLPTSDMASLHLNTTEEFHRKLDSVYASGGLDGIRNYVSQEFVPGRKLVMRSNYPGEPDREFIILDREVRMCNRDGGALLEKSPVVPRVAAALQITKRAVLHNWTRTTIPEPFYLTSWCVEFR